MGLKMMLRVFDTEEEVYQNCFNPSKQLVDGGPGWICDEQCYTPDDFVDEVMLHSDIGLYYDFNVDLETGRQLGTNEDGEVICPGLVYERGQSKAWAREDRIDQTTANCGKAPTAGLVEAYAKDQVASTLK